jgi:ApeA N-terminal domain 1
MSAWPMDSESFEGSKRSGKFTLSPGEEIAGELTIKGSETSLYVYDREHFATHKIPNDCVTGVLRDLTKVTLLWCRTAGAPGSAYREGESFKFAEITPQFVVHGRHHLSPVDKCVTEIMFTPDDAATMFHDFDAFGTVMDGAAPLMQQIADEHQKQSGRTIAIGEHPIILFFSGKYEIFSIDTSIGAISASHRPSGSFGSPRGVELKNKISVSIRFPEGVTFEESYERLLVMLRFIGLIVGRPQNLSDVAVRLASGDDNPVFLEVYACTPPKREPVQESFRPHPSDILLDAVRRPKEFETVLPRWVDRDREWIDARLRFFSAVSEQNQFGVDRIVGLANMFDILPKSAVPDDVTVSEELEKARKAARDLFKKFRDSIEGKSILGALGRIGKATLKHKIRHRAQLIVDAVGDKFPELFLVTDEAVDCRNHYVHGSVSNFDYNAHFGMLVFLTSTLEFVFAVSDLIEAGWDAKSWCDQQLGWSHPFAMYKHGYLGHLAELKKLLPAKSGN